MPVADTVTNVEHLILTDFNDRINASNEGIEVDLGGGNDIFDTNADQKGDDIVRAGTGNDKVFAGGGNDVVDGETGNDVINGEAGNDMISGGEGRDWLVGGTGDDSIEGGAGSDMIRGGEGIDTVSYANSAGAVSVDLSSLLSGQGYRRCRIRHDLGDREHHRQQIQ